MGIWLGSALPAVASQPDVSEVSFSVRGPLDTAADSQWNQSLSQGTDRVTLGASRGGQALTMGFLNIPQVSPLVPWIRGKGLEYSLTGPQGKVNTFALTDERIVSSKDIVGSSISVTGKGAKITGQLAALGATETAPGWNVASRLIFGEGSFASGYLKITGAMGYVAGKANTGSGVGGNAFRVAGESTDSSIRYRVYYERKDADYRFLSRPIGETDLNRLGASIGYGEMTVHLTEERSRLHDTTLPDGRLERLLAAEYRLTSAKNLPGSLFYQVGQRLQAGETSVVAGGGGRLEFCGSPFGGRIKGQILSLQDRSSSRRRGSESSIEIVPEMTVFTWLFQPGVSYRQKSDLLTNEDASDISIEAVLTKNPRLSEHVLEGSFGYTGTKVANVSMVDTLAAKVAVRRLKWKLLPGFREAGVSFTSEHRTIRQVPDSSDQRTYSFFLTLDLS